MALDENDEYRASASSRRHLAGGFTLRRWPDHGCFIAASIIAVLAATSQGAVPAAQHEGNAPGPGDWPAWRGPNGNGVANGPSPPLHWDASTNVIWKVEVPGRGHGSPTVVRNHVYLPTAEVDRRVQAVLAFDRATGELAWRRDVTEGASWGPAHNHNTHATSTVAADDRRLYAVFHHSEMLEVIALDHDGNFVWRKRVGGYRHDFGYAPSPLLYGDTVIVAAESKADGFLVALDRATGDEVWRIPRAGNNSFSSPAVGHVAGRDQLLISGNKQVVAYDPGLGTPLWQAKAVTRTTCGTMVWDGDMVFASGGYPGSATAGIKADGSAQVVWSNGVKCYEQSLVAHGGYVYGVNDSGVAHCWRAANGESMWRSRLSGSGVSASPVLVGERIYLSNEHGVTDVFNTDPSSFKLIATNRLGDDAFATPSICGGRIYFRVGHVRDGGRQEMLYCVGEK